MYWRERKIGWWNTNHSLKWVSKKAEWACVCGGEGVVSKSCTCSLEVPVCYNWANMSKWSMWWALGVGENCFFCTCRACVSPLTAFALLKPQHSRIAVQPSSVATVSQRSALNLSLVGKLRIIGFGFASVVEVNEDDEQRGRWLNCYWDIGSASYRDLPCFNDSWLSKKRIPFPVCCIEFFRLM